MRKQFGPFVIEGELARGGTGVVYRARDSRMNRSVVLKLLHVDDETSRRRLLREAKAMAQLRHPHVVPLHECGEHEGQLYLVLPLLEGRSLQDRLDSSGVLSVDATIQVGLQVGSALQEAHAAGLVHRDVKPANVLLDSQGDAQLTDFGVVKQVGTDQAATLSLSVQGNFLGTPGYWPKEQALGQHAQIGPSADVYGLAALLYALLTRQPPRQPSSLMTVLDGFDEPVQAARALQPDVPVWLDSLLLACLQDEPHARPTLGEVLESLTRRELTCAAPRPRRRSRTAWVLCGLVALAPLGTALALRSPSESPSAPPVEPPQEPAQDSGTPRFAAVREALAEGDNERAWFRLGKAYDGSEEAIAHTHALFNAVPIGSAQLWEGHSAGRDWAVLTGVRNRLQLARPRDTAVDQDGLNEAAQALQQSVVELCKSQDLEALADKVILELVNVYCADQRGLGVVEVPTYLGLGARLSRFPHATYAIGLLNFDSRAPDPPPRFLETAPPLLAGWALRKAPPTDLELNLARWITRVEALPPSAYTGLDRALGEVQQRLCDHALRRGDGLSRPPLELLGRLLRTHHYATYVAHEPGRRGLRSLVFQALCEGRPAGPEAQEQLAVERASTDEKSELFATVLIEQARALPPGARAELLAEADRALSERSQPLRSSWAARVHLRLLAREEHVDLPKIPSEPPNREVSKNPYVPWYARYTGEQSFGEGDAPGAPVLWLPGR